MKPLQRSTPPNPGKPKLCNNSLILNQSFLYKGHLITPWFVSLRIFQDELACKGTWFLQYSTTYRSKWRRVNRIKKDELWQTFDIELQLFLIFHTRWIWVVSFTPQLLCSWGKYPLCRLDKCLGGPWSIPDFMEKRKVSAPSGLELWFSIYPLFNLITIMTELHGSYWSKSEYTCTDI
jgi:hypothetical protein